MPICKNRDPKGRFVRKPVNFMYGKEVADIIDKYSIVSQTPAADTGALVEAENSTVARQKATPRMEARFKIPPEHDDPLSLWDVVRVLCVMAAMVALICWLITGGWNG